MSDFIVQFKEKIRKRRLRIAVIGLGYVGLPLSVEFAKKGFYVCGVDLDKDRVARINKKISYITDVNPADLKKAVSNGRLTAENGFRPLKNSDVVFICVPTPLKRKYHPDISFIIDAVKQIKMSLRSGQLIILESTTYPGTTEEEILPILEESGLKCGKDFYLAFSPERIDPGNKDYPVGKIPKIVGGAGEEAAAAAYLLYGSIIEKVIPVSSPKVAETVKLLENTFRIVNIGLINEMAMMAQKMGIDIWEVIEAAKTKPFGFMPFYPGPGVGGHCIPKDPLYLYWKAKRYGFTSRFIKLASRIIDYMPLYVVERIESLLKQKRSARVLIVGVSYKKDVLDLRKSPALDIIEILQSRKIAVSYYDPLIPYLRIGNIDSKSVDFKAGILGGFDCAVITTDHSSVDYGFLLRNSRFILDTRDVYKNIKDSRIIKL